MGYWNHAHKKPKHSLGSQRGGEEAGASGVECICRCSGRKFWPGVRAKPFENEGMVRNKGSEEKGGHVIAEGSAVPGDCGLL